MFLPSGETHPNGELKSLENSIDNQLDNPTFSVETFNGVLQVEWDPTASTTMLGLLPFFVEYLKLGNLFTSLVERCPIEYKSPNAPSVQDLLGTVLLSTLSGHKRYAHITALRYDDVSAQLLGMNRILSEDAVRRGLSKIEEVSGRKWLTGELRNSYYPLLSEPWILDVDTTVKVLYGKQEGAEVGYNPHKPGRPSHTYHTYFMANLRLVLDVEVQSGKHMAGSYSAPGLWEILETLPATHRPSFIRGDCAFGNEAILVAAEEHNQRYLFKLKQSKNVKALIKQISSLGGWEDAGQGWSGKTSELRLVGWSKSRKVIILRKAIKSTSADVGPAQLPTQKMLSLHQPEFDYIEANAEVYEFAVLVTDLTGEICAIAQHYRDRADCENVFDETKNQWGWGGYTTQDLQRCKLIARIIALVYNWWNLFVRLADPSKHMEATTSRPLLLNSPAKQTTHAGQKKLSLTCQHGKIGVVKLFLGRITNFFSELKKSAEQLTYEQAWFRILSKAVENYLKGRQLSLPICLA